MKVLIVGAGNVGAHIAYLCLFNSEIKEVLIYDIKKELLQGKCLDLNHSAGVLQRDIRFVPLENLKNVSADVVIITAGIPRKEEMSRFDLLEVNVSIMEKVISELDFSVLAKTIFIIVSNPVDVLTFYFYKKAQLKRNKILGMAGALDRGRFRYYLSLYLGKRVSQLNPLVIGAHSKDMFCIYEDENSHLVQRAKEDTQNAGAKVVSYYKGGSAYFAPAVAVNQLLEIIIQDKKEIIPAVAVLDGEYGYRDIAFGVPVELNKKGISKIIELDLKNKELAQLAKSVEGIKKSLDYLRDKRLL